MKNTQKNTTVKIGKKQNEMVKQLSEKRELTQKACLEKIIEDVYRAMKPHRNFLAKLRIEDLPSEEALVLLKKELDDLDKSMNYVIGILKVQEHKILNPILNNAKIIQAQNAEIIEALKRIR